MRTYQGIKTETRWVFDEHTDSPLKQIRYGVMYLTRRYKWDIFHWFDSTETEWGMWVQAPDHLEREMK